MKILDILKSVLSRMTTPNQSYGQRTVWVPAKNAGMYVDHDTALNFSAVYGAVAYRAETIASLPWQVMRRIPAGGKERASSHIVDSLLHTRPNPYMTPFAMKCFLLSMAQLWGNAYLEIEWDRARRPMALWPITSDRVAIKYDTDGALYYEVSNARGEKAPLMPSDVYHLAGMGFDGITGYSVVSLAQRSIGQGLASDEFMANFYANGTVLSGVFSHPKSLGDEAYERLKSEFEKKYGGPKRSWRPLIVEEDMKWQTMGMPLQDAQFLESRKFSVEDIARWFRVPPHKIGHLEKATFSNIEHQSIESVQESILPWAVRMEQEADYKLISQRNRNVFFTKINLKGLLRGDAKSRSEFYKIMRNEGIMNTNEIRELEDLNPIGPDGDKYVMQSQYTTLEKIGEESDLALTAPTDDQFEPAREAYRHILEDAAIRVLRREEGRAINAAGRYEQRQEFVRWMNKFFGDHIIYAASVLNPILNSMAQVVLNGRHEKLAGQIDTIVNIYLDRHVKDSRVAILEYYDDREPLWDEGERAAAISADLTEQIINIALLEGINREKEKRILDSGQG